MPYIPLEERAELAAGDPIKTPGRLNYILSVAILRYYRNSAQNYQAVNDIMGALEGAKQEFYRRVAIPYEDYKIKQNGDVYDGI